MKKLTFLLTCLLLVIPCQARIIAVDDDGPADFNNIQSAIDDANDGDTIIVADGIYRSEGWQNNPVADFRGKAITVRSENGPKNCILKWGDNVVRFWSGETPASVLSGFTIRGADPSGGISCWESSPTIMNNIITDNWSEYGEGAVFVHNCSPIIVGNIISGNEVYGPCAGIYCCHGSSPTITNNTIVGNGSYENNGGVYCDKESTAVISNCIFRDNGEYDLYGCTATYSCLEHEHAGTGNTHSEPGFVDPGHWVGWFAWVEGDYHLKSQAGHWDANSESWVRDDVTSACIDAGDVSSAIGYEPFPNGGVINMGAYGGTAEASKSYFGEPVCETIVAGDINGDCKVNFADLGLMALHWLQAR